MRDQIVAKTTFVKRFRFRHHLADKDAGVYELCRHIAVISQTSS